jgi:hypothetical protein
MNPLKGLLLGVQGLVLSYRSSKEDMSGKFPRLTSIGKLGLGLILASSLLWLALVVVPFLPLSPGQKAIGAAAVVVTAEILFWLGALLTGKEVVQKYRDRLQPKYLWQQLKQLWQKRP